MMTTASLPHLDERGFLKPRFQEAPPDLDSGNYVMTVSRQWVNLAEPDPAQFKIEDIAHSLSRIQRYNGHTKQHYSVADHCVIMSHASDPEFALAALLHDAAEAYLGDLIRPVKRHCRPFVEIEARLETALCRAFDLEEIYPPEVAEIDHYMIAIEGYALFGTDLRIGNRETKVAERLLGNSPSSLAGRLRKQLHCYRDWQQSKRAFLERYHELREIERRVKN